MIVNLLDKLATWWIDRRTGMLLKARPDFDENLEFRKMQFDQDGFCLDMRTNAWVSESMARFAFDAAEVLKKNGAENYLQFDVLPRLDRHLRPVRLTVQWANGKSPAQRVKELEEELERLKK